MYIADYQNTEKKKKKIKNIQLPYVEKIITNTQIECCQTKNV